MACPDLLHCFTQTQIFRWRRLKPTNLRVSLTEKIIHSNKSSNTNRIMEKLHLHRQRACNLLSDGNKSYIRGLRKRNGIFAACFAKVLKDSLISKTLKMLPKYRLSRCIVRHQSNLSSKCSVKDLLFQVVFFHLRRPQSGITGLRSEK